MKCHAKTKAGKSCSAPAAEGTDRCVMHSGRAAELGSRGGRRRTVYSPERLKEFSPPKSASDLRDLLAQSIIEIRTGKMDPKMANALGYIGSSYLRALEVADIESRLEKMELQINYATQAISTLRVQGASNGASGFGTRI
jgi:hypothetical protein